MNADTSCCDADGAYKRIIEAWAREVKKRGLNLSQLKRSTGFSRNSLTEWMDMKRDPSIANVSRCLHAVGLEMRIEGKSPGMTGMPEFRPDESESWDIFRFDFFPIAMERANCPAYRLSARAGLGYNVVYAWLQGRSKPKARALIKALYALGYEIHIQPTDKG